MSHFIVLLPGEREVLKKWQQQDSICDVCNVYIISQVKSQKLEPAKQAAY